MTALAHKIFLAAAFLSMLLWEVYVEFFASREAIRIITEYHVDKIFHLVGGAFVVGFLFLMFRFRQLGAFIAFVIAVSILWEAAEFLFDPKTIIFFEKSREAWIVDSAGDLAFSLAGGIFWARYLLSRQKKS